MGKKENEYSKLTKDFNLDSELSTIVEKNILPSKIAYKIGERLKEKNISITKEQLYKLAEKLQFALKSNKDFNQTNKINNEFVTNSDMKKLVESIEKLESRITNIEENKLQEMKDFKGKFVKTKDLQNNMYIQEDMEPLFEIPNDPESVVVLMKWLQYLVDKIGKINLADILGYYVDIDWISDDVRLDLIKYSKGIIDNKEVIKKGLTKLSTKEHIQSFLYIQKLKGQKLDERFIWKIDREMEKLAKSIEDYQFQ